MSPMDIVHPKVDVSGLEQTVQAICDRVDLLLIERAALLITCRMFTQAADDVRDLLNSKGFACPASIARAAEHARNAIAKVERQS